MPEHTSGPWDSDVTYASPHSLPLDPTREIRAIMGSDGDIAYLSHVQDGRAMADARLIAAAPDLLAACRSTLGCLDYLRNLWGDEAITRDVADRLRAAVDKATLGERPQENLARRFSEVATEIDPPADERGSWYLDVRRPGGAPPVVVEWRPDRGFGVSTPGPDDFGTGPDEVYTNAKAAFERVASLILSGGRTEPPQAVRLAESTNAHPGASNR